MTPEIAKLRASRAEALALERLCNGAGCGLLGTIAFLDAQALNAAIWVEKHDAEYAERLVVQSFAV